ncbi:TRAP transporter small permease subunit [Pseudahrensia aquimaris]|uniref:TRAP transporter small permease protein n=1 Tax=Pseudahrensia aquimaris TaxID=744461 RepID=A0ABW3FFC4_9HYPH
MVEHERNGPLDLLTWSFSRITMWLPFFIVLIILYEVVLRYFFASPTLWVNEMSLWVAGGIYLSAGLYAMQQRSHIRIFIIYDIAPLWLRRTFDVISTLCVCIFAFAVVWGGFGEAAVKFIRFEKLGTAYDPPLPATIKPLVLVMMLFLALQATSNLLRDWPAAPWVRKAFDVLVTATVIGLAAWTVNSLFISPPENLLVPTRWLVGIAVFLAVSVAIVVVGLVRDFNRTPAPVAEIDEIEEEAEILRAQVGAMPDQTLTGNPPKPTV